jgi:preprotein translocase subunit SecB
VEEKMVAGVLKVAGSRKPEAYQTIFSTEHEQVLKVIFQAARENISETLRRACFPGLCNYAARSFPHRSASVCQY